MRLTIYTDASCEENGRWSGVGAVALLEGEAVASLSAGIPACPTWEAEIEALFCGVELAHRLGAQTVHFRTDCQPLPLLLTPPARWVGMKRRHRELRKRWHAAAARFSACTLTWVPGAENLAHPWARAGLPAGGLE